MEVSKILERLGVKALTLMQQKAMETYAKEGDMVLLSPTGSGKTLAYLLPLVLNLTQEEGVLALVIVPSHELALQTDSVFKKMGTDFKSMTCYGGRPVMDECRKLKSVRPNVIIGTPGRINDHLYRGNVDGGTVRVLVIDEFDKCLELGFRDEMNHVISKLPNIRKRVLLSATDAPEIPDFVAVENVWCIDFLEQKEPVSGLKMYRVQSSGLDKLNVLYRLLCLLGIDRTLVFVNYRESAEQITRYLQKEHFPCGMFHGGMEQDLRERSLCKFRNGSCPVLISTDLAARGLDIADVQHIVHFHLPVSEEVFVHRNGRTARWQSGGEVYIMLGSDEELPVYIKNDIPVFDLPVRVLELPKLQWTTLYINKGRRDKVNRVDIVGFLYKKGLLGREDIGIIDVKERYSFVAIRQERVKPLLALIGGEKLKNMRVIIEEAR